MANEMIWKLAESGKTANTGRNHQKLTLIGFLPAWLTRQQHTKTFGQKSFALAPVKHKGTLESSANQTAHSLHVCMYVQCGSTWSQSYDFRIYNYNARAVVGKLERVFNVEETIFVFETR
jgi:hypothetical protein